MCGIAGIVHRDPSQKADQMRLRRMCISLRHRRPDDHGIFIDGPVGLGNRRLCTIDLATGHQPIFNESGSIAVVLNGEIYNFRELRPTLEAKGHRFSTQADTEVIFHLYEEYGVDAVQRLRGMFALALWDDDRQRLLLARDRVGKKPLFYAHLADRLLFASEIKAILQDPEVPTAIDLQAVDAYLAFQFIPHPLTIYQAIRKLPPAHCLIWEQGEVTIEPYWHWDFSRKTRLHDGELAEPLRAQLQEATRLRLISDVPVGALLSGGVDSSAVVALMSQAMDRPVPTFSIGFAEEAYNELPYARQVAQRFATNRHVSVVLNGDGGDAAFAGYDKYRFSLATIRQMFDAHVRGRRNHAHRLWALMLFAYWYRLMIEQRAYHMEPPFPNYEPLPVHSYVSSDRRRR